MIKQDLSPLVAIIILNWNKAEDTLACLASLEHLTYPDYEIVIVDNGSTDDSVSQIRAAYPGVQIIETGANLGYAGGNNVGIRYALEHGSAYVWLLNDDVVVAPNYLSLLIQVAETRSDIGFIGPLVCMREQPERILSAGGSFDPHMHPYMKGMGDLCSVQYPDVTEADFLSGCALLVKREVVEKVSPLDEDFFAYGEDVEWCFRGKRAGFSALLVPDAKVWHPDTRLRDENSARVMYYITRNHLLFLRKHRLGVGKMGYTLFRNMVWLINWSLNPKWRHIKPKRDALWLALRDFALHRFGKGKDL